MYRYSNCILVILLFLMSIASAQSAYLIGEIPASTPAEDARLLARFGYTDLIIMPSDNPPSGFIPLAGGEFRARVWLLRFPSALAALPQIPPELQVVPLRDLGENTYLATGPRWVELPKLPEKVISEELIAKPRCVLTQPTFQVFKSQAYDGRIAYLADQVNQDYIMDSVNDLVGFGTRYSYLPQCRDAAAYIHQRLEQAGWAASYHYYYQGYNLDSIVFTPNGNGFICGSKGTILRKLSAESNWEKISMETENELTDIFFINDLDGWVVGGFGDVFHTTDGGTTWSKVNTGIDPFFLGVCFVNSALGFICANDGSIIRTTDGGISWEVLSTGTTDPLFEIQFTDGLHGWAVGGWNGLILATTDGGDTWQLQTTPPLTTITLDHLCFIDNSQGWVIGNKNRTILKTIDGGSTWSQLTPPVGSEYLGGIQFLDGNHGWAVGDKGLVLRTSDGGENWTESRLDEDITLVGVCMKNLTDGFVCGYHVELFETVNGGTIWMDRQTNVDTLLAWINVIGTLPGRSSNQVIASAHYDSTSTDPYDAPGADDDASGCAALLEIARLMADSETYNTLKLVFFSGEEQGLLGSAAYVAQAVASGDLIKADYQADMIGYSVAANNQIAAWDHVTDGPGNNLYASGSLYANQIYWQLVIDPSMVYSDHASFWNNGISATMESEPHVQDNPYYHTPDDLPSSLDPVYLRNASAGLLATVVSEAGIVSGVPSNDAQQAYCYPNPYRPREGLLHFINLPAQTHFELYNISGERILKRSFSAPAGVGEWDGKLDGGMIPASGVYFFILQGQKGTGKTGKLAIIN